MYPDVQLFINGEWCSAITRKTIPVINPATEETIGHIAHAEKDDLDLAVNAAEQGFNAWKATPPFERSKVMRKAAELLRERVDKIAVIMTTEQGKPLAQARIETLAAADTIDWFAEEARRTYGQVIPSRQANVQQLAVKVPVGPVAAFTPWNFPINQVVRKLSAALAAGCSIIVKAPEDTPAAPAELIRAYADAGVPAGVINLVYGVPAEISEYLISHPSIRKISFTGSTAVGKHLAALAGQHMKKATMELGGHAPVIIFEDADLDTAAAQLAGAKFRNAGQVCIAPTRFLIQKSVYEKFIDKFVAAASKIKVDDGLKENTAMGPMAHQRGLESLERFVSDAIEKGANVRLGGKRLEDKGFFFEPTVLSEVPMDARAMSEEPFGPLALMVPFSTYEEAVVEANRLPYGLAAYAYTRSNATAMALGRDIESGMLTINHIGFGLPETPFGGVKDSGYGTEGGSEAIDAYLDTRFISQAGG